MAGRGWGRRGGGRGAGGRDMFGPPAVDEDGNKLTELIQGPPPDFPEIADLPHPLPIKDKHERLLDRWHRLRHSAQAGPFFVEEKQKLKDAKKINTNQFLGEEMNKEKKTRLALSAIVTFSPYYFPLELTSEKDRREAKKISKSSKSLEAFWSNQFSQDNEFEKFKELAAKGELAEKDQEDDEEEEEEDPADEESDGDGDDYVVGPDFDDDDGYEESDDGGMDEGIY